MADSIIMQLMVEAMAVNARIASMQAHDAASAREGSGSYTEEAYLWEANALSSISDAMRARNQS